MEISVPFNDMQKNALEKTAILCAENCPTSALAIRKIEEVKEIDNDWVVWGDWWSLI